MSPQPADPVASAIRLGDRLAHHAAGVHPRARLLDRPVGDFASSHRSRDLLSHLTFWTKIFAVAFGMGVVCAVVMPFQFGTNWSRYSYATDNVLSPLFAYEAPTAFFLKSAFLGVLLCGRHLVPHWAHCVSACRIARERCSRPSGSCLPTAGCGRRPARRWSTDASSQTNWLATAFNPFFPTRLGYTVVGFYVTTAFVALSIAASYLLRERFVAEARRMLS